MSNQSFSSPKTRRIKVIAAIVAFAAVIIEVAGNLVADEVRSVLAPYFTIVWIVFGVAIIVVISAAFWEAHKSSRQSLLGADDTSVQSRSVSVGGDVKGSTIITGDKNVIKSKK